MMGGSTTGHKPAKRGAPIVELPILQLASVMITGA